MKGSGQVAQRQAAVVDILIARFGYPAPVRAPQYPRRQHLGAEPEVFPDRLSAVQRGRDTPQVRARHVVLLHRVRVRVG